MAATYLDGDRLATVPVGTKAVKEMVTYKDKEGVEHRGEAYVLPLTKKGEPTHVARIHRDKADSEDAEPYIHISRNKNYGVIFCVTLLLVIIITNIPLRGMWSVVIIITIILMSDDLRPGRLVGHDHCNASSARHPHQRRRLHPAVVGPVRHLGVTLLIFDRQMYIEFRPGPVQRLHRDRRRREGLRHDRHETGEAAQRPVPAQGPRAGVGRPDGAHAGAGGEHFDMPNVLFISKKVKMIEEMLRRRKTGEGK